MNRDLLEAQQAFTGLLAQPVLTRQGAPEAFARVRRHGRTLTDWFDTRLGYRLVLTPTSARLLRLALAEDAATVHAPRPFEAPPRRALVLAVLAAAAAEDADDVTSTQDLSDRVAALSARDEVPVAPYDADRFTERQVFVRAVGLLVAAGALTPTERRSEDAREGWAHRRDSVGGAFDVQRDLLVRLVHPGNLRAALAARRGGTPRTAVAGAAALPPPTGSEAVTHARFGVMRRILETPVCLVEDLDEAERAYLTKQRSRLAEWCHDMTGWSLEHRQEGVALVPDVESGTDLPFPRQRAVDFATLLLLGRLLRESSGSPAAGGAVVVPAAALLVAAAHVREAHPRAMTAALDTPAAVADHAREILLALDLLRPGPAEGTWRLMPAAARFRDPRVESPRAVADSLAVADAPGRTTP